MINRLIKIALPITLFVGMITFALITLTNDTSYTVIESHSVNYFGLYTWNYYTFDIQKWLTSVQTSLKPEQLTDMLPQLPTLPSFPKQYDAVGWLNWIAKVLTVYVINWLGYVINWLFIAPLKIIFYPVNIVMSLLGIETSNLEIIQAFKTIYQINIPPVPYW